MSGSISLRDVRLQLGEAEIFRDLGFDVRASELLCLLGPSGCGKSTTLRLIGDLLPADGGTVRIDGLPPGQTWQRLAYVFQSPRLLPWKSVLDNAAFGLEMRQPKMSRRERRERAAAELRRVGLGRHLDKLPAMLSGGERQRVAIARALALDPEIILMDEPFSALDPSTRVSLRQQLVDIWQEARKTIVFVTHDIDEALFLADRIILLNGRPAEVARTLALEAERPRDVENDPAMRALRAELIAAFGMFETGQSNQRQGVPA